MAIAWAGFATLPRVLDLISVGSESAAARGVDVERPNGSRWSARRWRPARRSRSPGPVSFVGIIVPHLVRLVVGADHRLVLPASALFGGAFLIGCDLVARTIDRAARVPVGIVTAIIGGPCSYGCCSGEL
jgi:iron complex transport system permease protein